VSAVSGVGASVATDVPGVARAAYTAATGGASIGAAGAPPAVLSVVSVVSVAARGAVPTAAGVEEGSAAVKGVKGKKSFEATLKESAERVREELPVFDVRPAHGQFNIDVHGFITAHMTTAMPQTLEVISDKDETEIR
jgi:hypothetical protein